MTENVNKSLGKISKGASLIFIGMIFSTVTMFATRVFIIRSISRSQFGIYGLGTTIMSVAVTVSMLGLNNGVTKKISDYLQSEKSRIAYIIESSILIGLLSGSVICVLVYLSSDSISSVFNEPGLVFPLKILSLSLPFMILSRILIAIYRGFDRFKEKIYFQSVLRPILFLSLLILFYFIWGLTLTNVVYAYLSSSIGVGIIFFMYGRSNLSIKLKINKMTLKISKTLLLFSVPLMITSMLNLVLNWTDTLMLGYYKSSDIVGLYRATYPLSTYMTRVLGLFGFIFLPVVSKLYTKNLLADMKRTYQVITKWLFFLALPMLFIVFVFSEFILGFLFGPEYKAAGLTLKLLSLGFFTHIIVGLNGQSLIAIGRNKLVLYGSLIGAFLNVFLNLSLIPFFGIEGAGVASSLGYIGTNVYNSLMLHRISGLQPFYKNYLKVVGTSAILIVLFLILRSLIVIDLTSFLILTALFAGLYLVSIILLHSFDKEDLALVQKIEKKTGLNLDKIKKGIKKFS